MATYVTNNGEKVASKTVPVPDGYDSHDKFLSEMRTRFDTGSTFDEHNRIAAREDAKFVAGNQWDPLVEQRRRNLNKPVLTVNRLVAFLSQVFGSRLLNETEIRVYPDKSGTKEIAEIREGLIRNIFKNSQADLARDEAQKYQVIGGQGAYCLVVDYASDDVFEQQIGIKQIADPYAVVFDPLAVDPTAGDAKWAFVSDDIPQDEFKRRWPKAEPVDFGESNRWNQQGYWLEVDTVRIVSYWRMTTKGTKTLALMQDGTVQDVTDMDEFEYLPMVATRPETGMPYLREVPNTFAQMYVCSGNQILEGPYDYPISSIPVYRVSGWEVNDGQRLHRWGLIRFLKDPQRLINFWRSVLAEALVAAPRNKWLTTKAAIEGYQDLWRRSPMSDDPFLYFNDDGRPPERIEPPGVDQAIMLQAQASAQDLKDVSNIHEAAFGAPSNEVSGKAIQERQAISDVGTLIYVDRLKMADERCAKNINELIPHYYDTPRIIAVLGVDGKEEQIAINSSEETNVALGKYGISVSVGPSSITRRHRAAEAMMSFVNAMPEAAAPVMDLIAEAQDWPKATEFARRFRAMLPPGTVPADEMTPEQQAMAQQQEQMAQVQAQAAMAQQQADTSKTVAESQLAEARAKLSEAQAVKALADAQARLADVESKVTERELKGALDTLDQHNVLEAEDRDFAAKLRTMPRDDATENDNEQ